MGKDSSGKSSTTSIVNYTILLSMAAAILDTLGQQGKEVLMEALKPDRTPLRATVPTSERLEVVAMKTTVIVLVALAVYVAANKDNLLSDKPKDHPRPGLSK